MLERTLLWRRGGFCVNNMNMDHLCSRGRKSIKIHNVEQIFLCNSTTGVGKFEIFTSLKFCLLLVLVRRFVQFLKFWDYTFGRNNPIPILSGYSAGSPLMLHGIEVLCSQVMLV